MYSGVCWHLHIPGAKVKRCSEVISGYCPRKNNLEQISTSFELRSSNLEQENAAQDTKTQNKTLNVTQSEGAGHWLRLTSVDHVASEMPRDQWELQYSKCAMDIVLVVSMWKGEQHSRYCCKRCLMPPFRETIPISQQLTGYALDGMGRLD